MNLQTYAPVGDKENSPFFEEYVTKIYAAPPGDGPRGDRR